MANTASIQIVHATSTTQGAIGIIQLVGRAPERLLRELTGVAHWRPGRFRLAALADIDEGLVGLVSDDVAQIMPHGGMRVVQRLTTRLLELGAVHADEQAMHASGLYPEAADEIEALMLHALSRSASPLAIDALLAQPPRWCKANAEGRSVSEDERLLSGVLNRLLTPPMVVLAGLPNVGKSTLSNALMGRAMSIASDTAGTTRDYVSGRIDLAGLVVDWHDTPGLRSDADIIEQRAIAIARRLIEQADVLIAIRDADHDWPMLPRNADVFVMNKVDDACEVQTGISGSTRDSPLHISARTGCGLGAFTSIVRERLVPPSALKHSGLWVFDDRLLR